MYLFVSADRVGDATGGGLVTRHEAWALAEFAQSQGEEFRCIDRTVLEQAGAGQNPHDVWSWDRYAYHEFGNRVKLAHFYSGTFPTTVRKLKEGKAKVSFTIAAHDRAISKREHESLGLQFAYPHLVQEDQWQYYIGGYRRADVIVCPSTVAERTVREYGPTFANKKIVVVPHGCNIPDAPIAPLPEHFTVGYLGAFGPDKGIRYLLEAWKRLDYKDATLVLAGRESTGPFARYLLDRFGGGNIRLAGWYEDVSDFYNSISLLVQPSATEGFGIEVLEAMAAGRTVLCSDAAGAVDCVDPSAVFASCDVDSLAQKIDGMKWVYEHDLYPMKEDKLVDDPAFPNGKLDLVSVGLWNRGLAERFTWDKIRNQYIACWKEMLA